MDQKFILQTSVTTVKGETNVVKKQVFNYFYDDEAEQYTFYRIPKLLITDAYFRKLSSDAKILYGLMLDRMSLSVKNGWMDGKRRVYIYFSLEDVMEHLNVGKNKALKTIAELDTENGIGLIERIRQGQGKTAKIYVKKFTDQTSRSPELKPQEVCIANTNYNKKINTDSNNTESREKKSYRIPSEEIRWDEKGCEDTVRKNIDLDLLKVRNPYDTELLDGIFELIVDTIMTENETILVASNKYPTSFVRNKFLRLQPDHIEYVMTCLKENTTKVKNIKKYLLAALFNASSTIGGYYQAQFSYDHNLPS